MENDSFDDHNLSDEEEITVEKVLETLENAWLNEKFAPEILPHQAEMVDLMLGQIVHMEENLKALDNNDFRLITHKMELERIRYILASYLRCRLQKIEEYAQCILTEEEQRAVDKKRLTPSELEFANAFHGSIENHFQQLVFRHLPDQLNTNTKERVVRPNLNSYVFFKTKKPVTGVVIGENDEEIDLSVGSQHFLPYKLVADLVLKEDIQLT